MTDPTDFSGFDPDSEEVISREVIEHEPIVNDRTRARHVALQVLYEIDSADHAIGDVIQHHIDYSKDAQRVRSRIQRLVMGVHQHQAELDYLLQKFATEWPFHQIATVDRNILRLALYEIAVDQQVPVAVAIDEAVSLAKTYGSETSMRFINGVLGTVAANVDEVRRSFPGSDEVLEDFE